MASTETYSLTGDFPNQLCDPEQLTQEIQASSITTAVLYINVAVSSADNVDIVFESAISGGEKTTLDGLVAVHDGYGVPYDPFELHLENISNPHDTSAFNLDGYIEDIATTNLNDGLVLSPDGSGGIQWITAPSEDIPIWDAVVSQDGYGDYTLLSAAVSAGAKRIWVRNGTYIETSNIVLPDEAVIAGEGSSYIVFSGSVGLQIDASGGTKETAGTIGVTTDSTQVDGSGTTFTNLSPGDYILVGAAYYEIGSITDNTTLDLVEVYRGQTLSGLNYIGQTMYKQIILERILLTGSSGTALYCRAVNAISLRDIVIISNATNCQFVDSSTVGCDGCLWQYGTAAAPGVVFENVYSVGLNNCASKCNNGDGLLFDGCFCVFVSNCKGESNSGTGFDVTGNSSCVTFTSCGAALNDGTGVNVDPGCSKVTVNACLCRYNGDVGVDVDADECVVNACVISDNFTDGVWSGADSLVQGNHIDNNAGIGVALSGDNNNVVVNNHIHDNTGDGIDLAGSGNDDCLISSNFVANNGGYGIDIASGNTNCHMVNNLVIGNTLGQIDNSESTTVFGISASGNPTQGDILYYNGTNWTRLGFGTIGQALLTQGSGSNPVWSAPAPASHGSTHNPGSADAITTAAPPGTSVQIGNTAAVGTATSLARSDHVHTVTGGTPVAITDSTNAAGSAVTFARSDHQHSHGTRGGGTLHSNVSTTAAGFAPTAGTDNAVLRRSSTTVGWALIANANVDGSAAISVTKLAAGTNGQILGNVGGTNQWGAPSTFSVVTGPSSAVDNRIVRFDGTTGKLIQGGTDGPTYNDTGDIVIANQRQLRLSEGTAGGSNYIALRAPATLGADYTYTLPSSYGSSGQVLRTDGAGTLSWITVSGSGDVVGPASATDNAICRFDSTTGKLIQNSNVTINDSGDIYMNADGSSTGAPRVLGSANFSSGEAIQWQFGDAANVVQNSYGGSMTLHAYHTIILNGDANGFVSGFDTESSIGVLVRNSTAASPALVVRGAASQSGALQQWQSSTPTTLCSITSAGDFDANNHDLDNIRTATYNSVIAHGNMGTTETIDWSAGLRHSGTNSAILTITFTAPPGPCNCMLVLTNGGAYNITWPAAVLWPKGNEPNWTNSGVDIVAFFYDGTYYYGVGSLDFS